MGGVFFEYLQQLEMLAFFSGYPLVYLFIHVIARNRTLRSKKDVKYISLLPIAYALVGTLYLGLQFRNLYPDYSIQNIRQKIPQVYLFIWGLLSILFWIPKIANKPVLSILHSLVFFFLILRDLFFQVTGMISDRNILENDMRIYTVSLLLNLAAFTLSVLTSFLLGLYRKKR